MAVEKARDPGSASAEMSKYLDILAKDPNSRVFAPLAEAYRKAGLLDDAVETALEGLKVHPNYLGGRVALGRAYFEKRQYAEAAAEMQKVAKAAPDNIIAHKVLGQIAYSQSDLPAAEKSFKMVLLLDPRDQEAQQFIKGLAGAVPAVPAPPPLATAPESVPGAAHQPHVSQQAQRAPAPPASAPLPFEEIQAIEDIDLQADDIFGELAPPSSLPERFGRPASPAPPLAVLPAPAPREEFESEMPFDLEEPESWQADGDSPAVSSEAFQEPSAPEPPGVARAAGSEPTAFGEIDLESAALAGVRTEPVLSEPESATESPFEKFSREPGPRTAAAPPRAERGGTSVPRELEVETTAYTPPDIFIPPGVTGPAAAPDDELPRIDPAQEMVFTAPDDSLPAFAASESEAVPAVELEPELELEREPEPGPEPEPVPGIDFDFDLASELEPAAPHIGATIEETPRREEPAQEVSSHEGIPSVELAPGRESDLPGEEYEEFDAAAEPLEAGAGRGVFDTETLASIYSNQGFYGRAAAIYQRLLAQRPDDEELRGRLEGVLALERGKSGNQEPAEAAAAAVVRLPPPSPGAPAQGEFAAPPRTGQEQLVCQLQTLLETFKGGWPR